MEMPYPVFEKKFPTMDSLVELSSNLKDDYNKLKLSSVVRKNGEIEDAVSMVNGLYGWNDTFRMLLDVDEALSFKYLYFYNTCAYGFDEDDYEDVAFEVYQRALAEKVPEIVNWTPNE